MARRLRAALLGSSALSTAALAMLLAGPQAALAACTVTSNPNSVTCAANTTTTPTINTDGATANSSDRTQQFTANGNVSAGISAGVTVGGQGLFIQQEVANGALTFTNNGEAASLAGTSLPGLQLTTLGGLITYSGNGNVTGGFGPNDGLKAAANGGSISINTGTGTITSAGGDLGGLSAVTNGTGTIGVTTNGTIASAGWGIHTSAANGLTTINVDGGSVEGIRAISSGAGGVQINVNAGSVDRPDQSGIYVDSAGAGTIDVNIAAGATVGGTSTGLTIAAGGTGATNITVLGTLSGTLDGTAADFRGTLTVGNGGTDGTLVGDVSMQDSTTLLRFNRSDAVGFSDIISGAGALEKLGAGTLTLSGNNTYTGGTTISAGTLQIGNGAQISGSVLGTITNNAALIFNTSTFSSASFGGVISGSGTLGKLGAGRLTLSGTQTYTGATTVSGGTLAVNGSIAASSGVTVNSGGALGGTGTVGNTTIASGGALAPGNSIGTLTVNGNLTFNAGSSYTVEVSPTAADRTNVTGTATLTGATVQAVALAGSFRAQTYTILNATGGFGGTQFAGITGSSFAPGARNPHLTYDTNNVFLVLDPGTIQIPAGIGGNQTNAATAINNFVVNGGAPPAGFDALLNLTGAPLDNALGQVSGQPGASTAQTGFAATGQFINGVFDGAFGDGPGQGGALGFAESEANAYAPKRKLSREAKDAYAAVTPRDRRAPSFNARWNVWASVYGGNSRVNGDSSAGTSTTTGRIFGTAVGATYRFTPDTQAGFALGGAGSSFDVANGFGGGKADVFNAAIYAKHTRGAAYVAGLLGYSWQNTSTDRTVTISGTDILHASFKAQALAARLEGGWRYATSFAGIAPYTALQTTTFFVPSYGETATSGSNTFALNYASKTATATRGELGAKFDKAILVRNGVFTLKAKTAWAHDWNTDRSATATFQTLPGSTFTTNGAQPSANAALVSLGGEMKWHSGWSLAANLDGEFSRTTAGYAGKGTVKYAW